jgi:hypothetical protein
MISLPQPRRVLLVLPLCLGLLSAAELPLHIAFSGRTGPYTVAQWRQDWPGCEFEGGVAKGRVEVTEREGAKRLRVNFAPGEIGPEKGGAGWRFPFTRQEAVELRYTLRFGPGFEFVKGGKLPGLCGGPENVSGGRPANGSNGWSARLMWRREGRGEAYVYHAGQKGNYGDSFPFPDDYRFPTDSDVTVRMRVSMNEPGKNDGTLRVWIASGSEPERLVVERTDLVWRTTSAFAIDGLYFETFHGGGDSSWAPKKPCWAEFGDLSIRR